MNTTTYRRRGPSPTYTVRKKESQDPVRELVQKCAGTYNLVAVVEEDVQTLTAMKHVEGLVAFMCTLLKDGRMIAQGRGSAIFNPRFISRAVNMAFNSAISDSVIRATKVLDILRNPDSANAPTSQRNETSERATEKQREYLAQLISINVTDDDERERWQSQLDELTKQEASKLIEQFRR